MYTYMFVNMFEYVIVCSVWLAACLSVVLSVSLYGGLECVNALVFLGMDGHAHTSTHIHIRMHRWLYPYLATLLA